MSTGIELQINYFQKDTNGNMNEYGITDKELKKETGNYLSYVEKYEIETRSFILMKAGEIIEILREFYNETSRLALWIQNKQTVGLLYS